MKISHEIERVGDEAKAIARRSRKQVHSIFMKFLKWENCTRDASDALSTFVEFDEEKQNIFGLGI